MGRARAQVHRAVIAYQSRWGTVAIPTFQTLCEAGFLKDGGDDARLQAAYTELCLHLPPPPSVAGGRVEQVVLGRICVARPCAGRR